MSLPWLRLYTEFSSDPKIQILAFEDQRHYVMLLCLKRNGTLDAQTPCDSYRERLIAKALGLDPITAAEAKRRLMEGGLIGEDWQPSAWESRQRDSDLTEAERKADYRDRMKSKRDNVPDMSRTSPILSSPRVEEIRLDSERDSEKIKHKISLPSGAQSAVADDVRRVFDHWRRVWNHPQSALDPKRTATIRRALKGYSADALCEAISGYLNSSHHCGQNDRSTVYDGLHVLLRDSDHIDAGLRFSREPPVLSSKNTQHTIAVLQAWRPPEMRNAAAGLPEISDGNGDPGGDLRKRHLGPPH